MIEFSFAICLDGDERNLVLPLPNVDAAELVGRNLLQSLLVSGALKDGYVAVAEGTGEEPAWVGSWSPDGPNRVSWEAED